jgi:hypothetical protein
MAAPPGTHTRFDHLNLQAVFRHLFASHALRGPLWWPWDEDAAYCIDAPNLIPNGETRPWGPTFDDRELL